MKEKLKVVFSKERNKYAVFMLVLTSIIQALVGDSFAVPLGLVIGYIIAEYQKV